MALGEKSHTTRRGNASLRQGAVDFFRPPGTSVAIGKQVEFAGYPTRGKTMTSRERRWDELQARWAQGEKLSADEERERRAYAEHDPVARKELEIFAALRARAEEPGDPVADSLVARLLSPPMLSLLGMRHRTRRLAARSRRWWPCLRLRVARRMLPDMTTKPR